MADPASGGFSWLSLFGAGFVGAFVVKAVDILYAEVRRRADRKQSAALFLDSHIDPLLKTADEVVGKLHSLATEDFQSLAGRAFRLEQIDDNDFGSLLFLLARLWAHIEIIRQEGLSIALGSDPRGAQLQSFVNCLESRHVRIVDRIAQRAIGELLIKPGTSPPRTMGYVEFVRMVEGNEDTRRWITPLSNALLRTQHARVRQQLLQYGIIVHALIDTLDAKHLVTKDRPSYPNKLSVKTKRDIYYRVFKVYLPFVINRHKYTLKTIKHLP
jgi:hypothetical protein